MEIKPVRYFDPRSVENNVEVLYEEDYNGIHLVVVNLGKYPCAYCENIVHLDCPSNSWDWSALPHGGITFEGEAYWNPDDHRRYIGWDYGHAGDFDGYYVDKIQINAFYGECHKWTTEEIIEDTKRFIDFLVTRPIW